MKDIKNRSSDGNPLPNFGAAFLQPVKLAEYMIVLEPHEDLCNRIMKVKQCFATSFYTRHAVAMKPHIAIVRFRQYEMKEAILTNKIKLIAMSLPALKLDLEGFSSFPSHTIFLKLQTHEPVKLISKKLRQAQSLMTINKENKPLFINETNIPVALKLLPWQYEKGWQEYAHKHFRGSFIANHLLCLKRSEGSKNWQVVGRYEMLNLPVETTQGDLFG